jgi:hypothetical protein
MEKLKNRIRKHFEDSNDPMIEKLSKKDLKYIDEYMNHSSSNKKIQRIECDSERLVINPGDDDSGITYFRKE